MAEYIIVLPYTVWFGFFEILSKRGGAEVTRSTCSIVGENPEFGRNVVAD